MTVGIQILDASGKAVLDITDYTGSPLSAFNTNGSISGSHTDALVIDKRPYYFTSNTRSLAVEDVIAEVMPEININTTTGEISWEFVGITETEAMYADIYYGTY